MKSNLDYLKGSSFTHRNPCTTLVGDSNLHGPTLWSNRHGKPGPDFSCLVVVADHIRFDHCPNFQIGIFHLGTRCKAHRWYLPYAWSWDAQWIGWIPVAPARSFLPWMWDQNCIKVYNTYILRYIYIHITLYCYIILYYIVLYYHIILYHIISYYIISNNII